MYTFRAFSEGKTPEDEWEKSAGIRFSSKSEKTLLRRIWRNPQEIEEFLGNEGYKMLGAGSFSSVWGKRSVKNTIKVSHHRDTAWVNYATYAMKNRRNPYLLNIDWMKRYDTAEDKFFIASMEKLIPFEDKKALFNKFVTDPVEATVFWMHPGLSYFREQDFIQPILKRMTKKNTMRGVESILKRAGVLEKAEKSLFWATINKIQRVDPGSMLDLHDGNLMFRPRGQIVITDPTAWGTVTRG